MLGHSPPPVHPDDHFDSVDNEESSTSQQKRCKNRVKQPRKE
jgi:hypothetical protein